MQRSVSKRGGNNGFFKKLILYLMMDYEVHGKIEKFEEFLRLGYKGINEKFHPQKPVDAEELWNCSLFLAKVIDRARLISAISTEAGLRQFQADYEKSHGKQVDLKALTDDFWLRAIGGHVGIVGQISFSCLTFSEIRAYRKELTFLSDQQAHDKQNMMDTLKFKKIDFEPVILQYEQANQISLDRDGVYFKKWSSEKDGMVNFSNIEAHFQGFLDCWEQFEFILAYKARRSAEEDGGFLFITGEDFQQLHEEHRKLYPGIPEPGEFLDNLQFIAFERGYKIRFHAAESKHNYWHALANKVSGRYWTLLDRDDQRSDKQEALKEWLFKTGHIDAYNPLAGATNAAQMSFCREAYLFLKNEPDFAGGKDEIRKMVYDGSFKGGFRQLKNDRVLYDMAATEPFSVYKRLTDGTLDQNNILYDQRSRHSVNKLINAFICHEHKYLPNYDEEGGLLPQEPFHRIKDLLLMAPERPFLTWKICYLVLHRRQGLLPSFFVQPKLAGLGFVLAEELAVIHPADPVNAEIWKQCTSLLISCATRLSFRPKEVAQIIYQLFGELNQKKYEYARGGRQSVDPALEAARTKREEEILDLLINWEQPTHLKYQVPALFNYLVFYFKHYKVLDLYHNRLVRFPMLQWDGIFRLMKVIDSSKFKTYHTDLEPQRRALANLFLKSYLQLLETDEAIGFDFETRTDTVGKITWSESIERLNKLQWIYPVYHLHKHHLIQQFLAPRIALEASSDILHEKNRIHILQLRTHVGVLLELLKKLVSPEIPYGFEKAKLSEIRKLVEAQIITFVRQYSTNNPAVGHFDIFEFNHEKSLFGHENEALLPRLARAINWFSDKEAIIEAIRTSGDYHKLLTMLEWITSYGIRNKLLEQAQGADVLAILDKQHWIPEIKNILLQLSHNRELLEKLEDALVYYEVTISDPREDFQNKMEAFRIRLLIAYFKMDEQMLNDAKAPVFPANVHTNDLTGDDYRSFYRGLMYLSAQPENAYTIFNTLHKRFPQYPSLAINRLNAAYKLAEKNNDTQGFADALGEWQEAANHYTDAHKHEIEPNIWILLLQLYLKLGFDEQFDKLFNDLELPYQLLPDILQLKVESLVGRGRRAEAFYWIERGEAYHKFDDISQLQFLEDLKLKVKGLDNIDELQYQYKRIFDSTPDKLIQVIPARLNGKTSMPEFLIQEFVYAADKMLDKIRAVEKINDENKYNDLLEVILESRIYNYGWTISGQKRGAFSGELGPQPGMRDLPLLGADTKIMLVGEALIYRGAGTAVPHLEKIFNYYHQRETLLIIYYDLDNATNFENHWKNYPIDIIPKCQYPSGYGLTGSFTDVSADFKVNASAIKVGKTEHASGTLIYHIFIQIKYNL